MTDSLFYVHSHDADSGEQYITVFYPGRAPQTASTSSHGNFQEILDLAIANDISVLDKFDLSEVVAGRFEALTDRVTVRGGQVYFDGDPVHNALTKQVVRFLSEDTDDWVPLVNFFEAVQTNPEPHSREQLYEWLDRHDFAIDQDGSFIAYKGVAPAGTDENGNAVYESINSGYGIVNGEEQNGRLRQQDGDIVEIPRSKVQHDPAVGCSTGLHVGTYEYASGWARGALLKVLVNPRDVVSVPTDCNAQKVRVCRYQILETIDHKITSAFAPTSREDGVYDEDLDDDYDYDYDYDD